MWTGITVLRKVIECSSKAFVSGICQQRIELRFIHTEGIRMQILLIGKELVPYWGFKLNTLHFQSFWLTLFRLGKVNAVSRTFLYRVRVSDLFAAFPPRN